MAYQHALSLAEHYKAKLVALHAIELRKYPFADYAGCEADFAKFSRALCEGGEVRLREFVNKHTWPGIHPHLLVQLGNASDSILSLVQSESVELIVMGTHGRRGFDRLVLGSTTDRVMRKAGCPVLVISKLPQEWLNTNPETRPSHRLNRILYCTDFSEHSEGALQNAISAAAEYDAELTLLHVIERIPSSTKKDEVIAACAKELDKMISPEVRKKVNVKTLVKAGKPYAEVVQHALEAQTDMIVLAARGAEALDRAVFGSTSYRVIQLGPCPVLVVHT